MDDDARLSRQHVACCIKRVNHEMYMYCTSSSRERLARAGCSASSSSSPSSSPCDSGALCAVTVTYDVVGSALWRAATAMMVVTFRITSSSSSSSPTFLLRFHISPQYPFSPPELFVVSEDPMKNCAAAAAAAAATEEEYGVYLARSFALMAALDRRSGTVHHASDWSRANSRFAWHDGPSTSMLAYPNWRPTYHLIDLVNEFMDLRRTKTRCMLMFFLNRVCVRYGAPSFAETCISQYF